MRMQVTPASSLISAVLFMIAVGSGSPPIVVAPSTQSHGSPPRAATSYADHDEFNGWLEAAKTVDVRARFAAHRKGPLHRRSDREAGRFAVRARPRAVQVEIGKAQDSRSARSLRPRRLAAVKEEARLAELLEPKAVLAFDKIDKMQADAKYPGTAETQRRKRTSGRAATRPGILPNHSRNWRPHQQGQLTGATW